MLSLFRLLSHTGEYKNIDLILDNLEDTKPKVTGRLGFVKIDPGGQGGGLGFRT